MKRFVVVMTVWAMGVAGVLAGVVFPSSASAAVPTNPGAYVASVMQSRLLDTREGIGAAKAAVLPGKAVALQVTGKADVPATGVVSAVVLNVTVTAPTQAGFITVYGSAARPPVSNLNFVAGQTVPNLVVAPVDAAGKVNLFNGSAGTTQIIADIVGWHLTGAQGEGAYQRLTPQRLLDTRIGTGAPKAMVPSNQTVDLTVTGVGKVPAGASAVVLNVTATGSTKAGYISVFNPDKATPSASNLNFVAGQTVPNLVVAPVSADGRVRLLNGSPGSTSLIADVFGYYTGGIPSTNGAFGAVPTAERLLDTRDSTGMPGTGSQPVAGNGSVALNVTGGGSSVPAGVSAVVMNVTVTKPAKAGFITVHPGSSNVNFVAGQDVANLVIAPVSVDGRVTLFNGSLGATQLIADVTGYYLGSDANVTPVTTTTALTVTPPSGAAAPVSPTLTATVTPGVVGNVEFFNNGTSLGSSPVTGDAATKLLPAIIIAGSFTYTATFTPTDAAAFNPSTSTPVVYVVAAPAAAATTTVLEVTPPVGEALANPTLRATVTNGAAGSVQFFKNGLTSLGSSTVAFGLATITLADIPVGSYSYTATFTPTDAAAFNPSTSAAVAFVVSDTTPPEPVSGLTFVSRTVAGVPQVELNWTNPTVDFQGVMIRRSLGSIAPATVNDGELLTADHRLEKYINEAGLEFGKVYSYSVFAHDAAGNYAAPVSVTVPTEVSPTGAVLSINGSTGTAKTTANGFEPRFVVTGSHAGPGVSITSGSIDFGDGTTETFAGDPAGWDVFHTYVTPTTPGTPLDVTLQVTDSAGVTASDTVKLTVLPAPTASITVTNKPGRPGVTTFALTSDTPAGTVFTDYVVDYGDGTPIQEPLGTLPETLTHTFGADGPFTVTITAYNDADGFVTASTTLSFDGTAPGRVSGLGATVVSNTAIDLAWTNPVDADFAGVMIRRKAGATAPATVTDGTLVTVLAAPATSYSDTGLMAGNEYSYAVFSKDEVPNYAVGFGVTATTTGTDTTPPGVVTGLHVNVLSSGDNSISLSWTNPLDEDFTGVTIRRSLGSVAPATVNDGALVSDFSDRADYVVDVGLDAGTEYTYAVFAHDGVPNYAAGVNTLPYTTTGSSPLVPPGPVNTLTATVTSDTEITLAWVNPLDVDFAGVTIRRAEGPIAPTSAIDGDEVVVPASATATSFKDTLLTPGTVYSYAVFAYDADNNLSTIATVINKLTTQTTTAVLSVDTAKVTLGTEIFFDASLSYAATGKTLSGTLSYGDGITEVLNGDPFNWLFGHSYTSIGAKTVTLDLTDSAGVHVVKEVTVTGSVAPTALISIVGNPTTVQHGVPVTFTLTPTTPAGTQFVSWIVRSDFGGDFHLGTPPGTYTNTFARAGTYTVTFLVFNDATGGDVEASMDVEVL